MTDIEVYEVLVRYSRRYGNWGLESLDVAHEAYVIYRLRAPEEVNLAYLGLVARRAASNLYRPAARVPASLDLEYGEETLASFLPALGDLEAETIARMDLEALAARIVGEPRLLLILPPLIYYEDRHVARWLGVQPNTVTVHRWKAREALRLEARMPKFRLAPSVVALARELAGYAS